jgi:hypothetical protein
MVSFLEVMLFLVFITAVYIPLFNEEILIDFLE